MGNQSIKDLGLEENGELHRSESKSSSLDSDRGFEVIEKESFDCTDASKIPDTDGSCVKAKKVRFFKSKNGEVVTNETDGLGEEQETLETLLKKIPRNKKDMERMTRRQCIEIHGKNELIRIGRAILDQLTTERQRNLERIEEKEQVIRDKEVAIEFFTMKVERLSQQIEQKERELQDKERRLEEAGEKLTLSQRQTREQEATIKEMQQTVQGRDQWEDGKRKSNSSASILLQRRIEMGSLRLEGERYQLQLREKDNAIEQKEKHGHKLSQENDRLQNQLRESERRCLEKQVKLDHLHKEKERGIAYVKKLEVNCVEKRTVLEKSKEDNRAYRQQLEQKERLISEKQRGLERTERRNAELSNQVQTLQEQLQNERDSRRRSVDMLRDEKHRCGERLRQVQRELESQRRSSRNLEFDCHRAKTSLEILRQEQPWIISKNEITVSKKVLGTGAWGRVVEGKFRGTKVAVKEIHEVIQSAHNRLLFDREIMFATLVRHPCILQFLGVADYRMNNPLLVTELMDMTLSELMRREGALDNRNMLIIGLDIAYGLNYLHCFRPTPILHRDVNCGNVMVWKQGDKWRGKLCDFGSAEFVSQDMSINPGNPFYSAPEASESRQSAKMDVYSYGVLLCEMGTGETPNPSDRERQVNLIWHKKAREIITSCTDEDPSERPTMTEVIYELETIEN